MSPERTCAGAATAVAASLLLPAGALAVAWPMTGHDAAHTSRTSVVSAQRPVLLPGWPVTGAGELAPLVAPDGTVRLGLPGGGEAGIVNADGSWRRVAPAPRAVAAGGDARLDGFAEGGSGPTTRPTSS